MSGRQQGTIRPRSMQPPQGSGGRASHPGGAPPAHPGSEQTMVLGVPNDQVARARSPSEKLQPKRPPRPPRNRRAKVQRRRLGPFWRAVNGLLTLMLLVMAGLGAGAILLKTKFDEAGPLASNMIFQVPRGRGVNAIASLLQSKGIVSDSRLFVANVYYKRVQSKLKAGRYKISARSSISTVVDKLVKGKAVSYRVTLPEGLTSQQMVARLNRAKHMSGEITQIPPEGTLLPNTYSFAPGKSRVDFLNRLRAAQQVVLDRLWEARDPDTPLRSKQEALILASIIEKETGIDGERARVGSVFINRLRKGMKLQSDPTIIYGLVGGQGKLGHPLRRSELNRKTAYNTYQIPRLPPTPICNPGAAAIKAALNPAKTNDLYFVANGTGGHIFASTLKAHNFNVRNWRKIERAMRAKQKLAAIAAAKQKSAAAARAASSGENGAGGSAVPVPVTLTRPLTQTGAGVAPVNTGSVASAKPRFKLLNRRAAAIGSAGGFVPLPVRKPKKFR